MIEPGIEAVAKPKRRGRLLVFLFVIIFFIGAFTYWRHAGQPTKLHMDSSQAVGVAKVISGSMAQTVSALGTVTPTATVTVLPQLNGYLTDVAFTEGETVSKGQYLAQIDPRPYQVQLEQYSAQQAKDSATLAQAKSDLARYEILQKQDSISAQQVADQKFLVAQQAAIVQVDQAQIDTAKLNITYCHIIAPIAGTVGLRLVDPGNYVTSGSTTGIAVIASTTPITVIFSIPQTELAPVLAGVQSGATLVASAYSSDDSTKIADGTLAAVDNQVNTSTGTVKLRASFANTNNVLFPNEFVNIHLIVKTLQNVPLVPAQAVQNGAPGSYVYVVGDNHTVSVQVVTPGTSDGTNTVITKGLNIGQMVVTDGVDRLAEGMKVSIVGQAADTATTATHKKPVSHTPTQ